MNHTQKLLLNMLSHSLFHTEAPVLPEQEWNDLLVEAKLQGVYPLIFQACKSQLMQLADAKEYAVSENSFFNYIGLGVNSIHDHRQLHNLMTENGVPYVSIKGIGSASYYPEPNLRTFGDVDFLVRKEDIDRAAAVLEREGFVRTEDKEHVFHNSFHKGRQVLELHWEAGIIPGNECGNRCNHYISDIIETGRMYDGVLIPDDFHHGIVLLIHTAGHMLRTGIGLRHLCDWAVYANRVDVSPYEAQFREMGLWRFAQLLTQVSVQYLGCPEKPWAVEEEDVSDGSILQCMIEDFLEAGEFGRKDPERINEAKIMTTGAQGNVGSHALLQLFRMLTEKAYRAMPVCWKAKVLLPVGWVYVGVRHLRRIRHGTRPQIHLKKMLEGANTRKAIYKEFRLFE